jgi:plastocyanin
MKNITSPGRVLIAVIALAVMSSGAASAVPPTIKITIAGMAFSAPEVTVRVGDTIEWINKDVVDHTSTEKKASLWNVSIAPGKSEKVVMKKAGTFDYYCRYHPNMVARVIVSGRTTKSAR